MSANNARLLVTIMLLSTAIFPPAIITAAQPIYLPLVLSPQPDLEYFLCTWVNDVDGFWIDTDGDGESDERVRYLLIDSTERYECYSDEAKQRNTELVFGKTIGLEFDTTNRGIYGRLLRYVWVDDVCVNALLVREGYAKVAYIWENRRHLEWYLHEQDLALAENAGMWGSCPYPTPTPYPLYQ